MEAAADIIYGGRIGPNLQKTKDVIGTQVRWASHRLGPAGEGRQARRILLTFFWGTRNFFRGKWVTYAGQHTTGCPPSVRAVGHSPKGELGRRDDLARLPYFFQTLIPNCQSIPITAIKTLAVTRTHLLRLVQPI